MQKTLIDPFELAARSLPAGVHPSAPVTAPEEAEASANDRATHEEHAKALPLRVPRAEAWARVRCWCSED